MRTNVITFFCLSFFVIAIGKFDIVGADDTPQAHYEPPFTGYQTPHVKWAIPWCGGSTKVLALVASRQTRESGKGEYAQPGMKFRDAIELVQRFDFALDTVLMQGQYSGLALVGEKAQNQLTEFLEHNKYNAIVLGNVSFDHLQPKHKFLILEQVKNGAGLVSIKFSPKKVFLKDKQIETPAEIYSASGIWKESLFQKPESEKAAVNQICKTFKIAKGRGVCINYPIEPLSVTPAIDYSPENRASYEYWSAFVGRSILWAAKQNPKVRIENSGDSSKQIIISNISGRDLSLTANITVKDIRGENPRTVSGKINLPKSGKKALNVPCDNLPNGRYYAEVIVREDNKVAGFGTSVFDISDNPKISSTTLSSDYTELNGTVTLKVNAAEAANRILRAELLTADRRTVWREEKAAGATSFELMLSENLLPTIAMRVRISLLQKYKVVDVRELPLTVTMRNREGFKFIVYERDNDVLSYYAFRRLHMEGGITSSVCWVDPGEVLASNNISQMLYLHKVDTKTDKNGFFKNYSWNDDAAIDSYLSRILAKRDQTRKHGALAYSLGDEPPTQGADNSPACRKAYIEYLKERYETIEKLNGIWSSNYTSFDEFNLLKKNDLAEETAKEKGLYPRWFDRQRFMRRSFTNVFSCFKKQASSHDPDAIIGFEAAGKLDEFPDFEGLLSENGFWTTYNDTGWDIIRSMTDNDFVTSKWMGYTHSGESLVNYSWQSIARGADSLFYWRWCGIGKFHGLVDPNLDIWSEAKKVFNSTRIMREGFGDLWTESKQQDDRIAILLSEESHAASLCGEYEKIGAYSTAQSSLLKLLRNFGLGFRYVTPDQVKSGILEENGTKLLFLVSAYAIGDDLAQSIKTYVNNGGSVVADIRPGTCDKYCLFRDNGVLDDMFGVIHGKNFEIKTGPGTLSFSGKSFALSQSSVDVTMKSDNNKSSKKSPVLMQFNKYGKGMTLLLNATFHALDGIEKKSDFRKAREFWTTVFRRCDYQASVQVFSDATKFSAIEATRKVAGNLEIVAIYSPDNHKVRLQYPEPKYFYGVNVNLPEKRSRDSRFEVPKGHAKFVVVSDKAMPAPYVKVSTKETVAGQKTGLLLAMPEGYENGYYVYLQDPDGKTADWSRKSLVTKSGKAVYSWTFAYEDKPGDWTVVVTPSYGKIPAPLKIKLKANTK